MRLIERLAAMCALTFSTLAPLAGCTHADQAVAGEAGGYTLTLRVEGVRSASGQLRADLLGRTGGSGAPRRVTFGVQDAVAGVNVMAFPNLPTGEYAVQLYHDENGNGVVDMNVTGVPLEGYGFSNVPLVQGGIPPFERMKVVVSADASATAVLAYAP
jgi:uncharacterized protein (DUF2141 family)